MSTSTPTYMTPSVPSQSGDIKPTLLAFHGSGSNATIHTIQLARLSRLLKSHFDIISLQGPFPSPAGPGILPFFEGCGPYYRWIPPSEKLSIEGMRSGAGSSTLPPKIEDLVRSTVDSVRAKGGRVVGLLGFSQGTRVVAGLLKAAESVRQLGPVKGETDWLDFDFAVSACGSYPPPLVPDAATKAYGEDAVMKMKIEIPTLHLLGSQDEWLWAGKLLIDGHYEEGEGKSAVRVLDMGHHYPVKPEDTAGIVEWVMETYGKSSGKQAAEI